MLRPQTWINLIHLRVFQMLEEIPLNFFPIITIWGIYFLCVWAFPKTTNVTTSKQRSVYINLHYPYNLHFLTPPLPLIYYTSFIIMILTLTSLRDSWAFYFAIWDEIWSVRVDGLISFLRFIITGYLKPIYIWLRESFSFLRLNICFCNFMRMKMFCFFFTYNSAII